MKTFSLTLALILTSSLLTPIAKAQDAIIDGATVNSVMAGGVTHFTLKQPMTLPGNSANVIFSTFSDGYCFLNFIKATEEIRQLNCGPVNNCPPRVLNVAPKTTTVEERSRKVMILMPVVGDPTVASIQCYLGNSSAGALRQAVSPYFSVTYPRVTQAELETPSLPGSETENAALGI